MAADASQALEELQRQHTAAVEREQRAALESNAESEARFESDEDTSPPAPEPTRAPEHRPESPPAAEPPRDDAATPTPDEPEAQPVPEEPVRDAASEIPAQLIEQARHRGMTEAEVRSLGSPAAVQAILATMDRRLLEQNRAAMNRAQQPAPAPQQPAQQPYTPPQPAQPGPGDVGYTPQLDAEMYGEDVKNEFVRLHEAINNRLEQIRQDAMRPVQAMRAQEELRDVDSFFAKIGQEWHETFGKGGTMSPTLRDIERQERHKVIASAHALAQADAQLGRVQQDRHALLDRALRAEYGDRFINNKLNGVARDMKQRASQGSERPVARQTKAVETDADARIDAIIARMGIGGNAKPTEF
jgi:hypothetical protein